MLYSMHAEIKHWVDAGKRGSVVNVGSLCGEHAGVCGTMYTASKFATQGFSKQAAVKYAPRGIRVNVLNPGAASSAGREAAPAAPAAHTPAVADAGAGLIHTQMLRDDYGERLGPDDPKWTEGRKAISRGARTEPGEPGELATPAAPRQAVDRAIPLGSIAEPWEMAGPILFLSDDGRASYVTGATLSADGALTQARADAGRWAGGGHSFAPLASHARWAPSTRRWRPSRAALRRPRRQRRASSEVRNLFEVRLAGRVARLCTSLLPCEL